MGGATVAPKKVLTDEEKNVETLINYGLPFVLMIYLGLVLKKYSLADFSGLVTNDYLLLGFKDVDALRKHLVDNTVASAIWGLTYMYIRKWANPEFRSKTWKYRQDGYFASLSVFVTTLLKAVCNNIANKL